MSPIHTSRLMPMTGGPLFHLGLAEGFPNRLGNLSKPRE
jgi:hypothetical protein